MNLSARRGGPPAAVGSIVAGPLAGVPTRRRSFLASINGPGCFKKRICFVFLLFLQVSKALGSPDSSDSSQNGDPAIEDSSSGAAALPDGSSESHAKDSNGSEETIDFAPGCGSDLLRHKISPGEVPKSSPESWKLEHDELRQKISGSNKVDIVWYGDTTTKLIDVFKEHHNIDAWKTVIGDINSTLMGIPGDGTSQLLYRVQRGEWTSAMSPEVVVLTAGISNVFQLYSEKGNRVANSDIRSMARRARDDMRHLLAYLHRQDCEIKVVITGLLPAVVLGQDPNCWPGRLSTAIGRVNDMYKQLADEFSHVVFANCSTPFIKQSEQEISQINQELMPDLMSPGPQGYTIFAECVMHHVRGLLRPSFPPAPPTPQHEESPPQQEEVRNGTLDVLIEPKLTNETTADLEFSLFVSSWSQCSDVCGGGRQYRMAACFYGTVSVDMSLCGGIRSAEIDLGLELIRPCNYISCVSGEDPVPEDPESLQVPFAAASSAEQGRGMEPAPRTRAAPTPVQSPQSSSSSPIMEMGQPTVHHSPPSSSSPKMEIAEPSVSGDETVEGRQHVVKDDVKEPHLLTISYGDNNVRVVPQSMDGTTADLSGFSSSGSSQCLKLGCIKISHSSIRWWKAMASTAATMAIVLAFAFPCR